MIAIFFSILLLVLLAKVTTGTGPLSLPGRDVGGINPGGTPVGGGFGYYDGSFTDSGPRNPLIMKGSGALVIAGTPVAETLEDLSLQPSFLDLFCSDVRLAIDDPVVGAKYSDTEIIRLGGLAMRQVFKDLTTVTTRPVVLTHDISINTTDLLYYIPPCIGEILHIGEFDTTLNRWKWKLRPRSRFNSYVRTIRVEGKRVKLEAPATSAFTLRIEYIPGTDYYPHEAVRKFSAATMTGNDTFAIIEPNREATMLVRGVVDNRQDAYIGSLLRVWRLYTTDDSPSIVQERIITGYRLTVGATGDGGTQRLLTLDSDFDTAIVQDGATNYQYEIVPIFWEGVRQCMMLRAALTIAGISGLKEKESSLLQEYRAAMRNERILESYLNSADNQSFDGDTDEAVHDGLGLGQTGYLTGFGGTS